VESCISSISSVRNLSKRVRNPKKKQRAGPKASTAKFKFYHMPDDVRPKDLKFSKDCEGNIPSILQNHMSNNYG